MFISNSNIPPKAKTCLNRCRDQNAAEPYMHLVSAKAVLPRPAKPAFWVVSADSF